jgi:molybdenum cofactor biosynthesis enzyme MoaA
MPEPSNPSQEDIEEPITTAPPEVERIIREVIRLEKANLSSDRPRIRADVLKIIKDVVK